VDKLTLNSYAKLNLYLSVLGLRRDGYHDVLTIFERISLADKIILKTRTDTKINLVCRKKGLPKDFSQNLAYKSAKLLQESFKVNKGADIEIIKNIPIGSGMAGGSSNAAYTLIGLNKLWRLNLKSAQMAGLAGRIGSDVPFFIHNSPFAKGEGRGERIKPLKSLKNVKLWHILAVPDLKVSTPLIYEKWDDFKDMNMLTMPEYDVKILLSGLKNKDQTCLNKAVYNSLEPVTMKLYPQVRRVKNRLLSLGAQSILMSGSGPAVFGIVSSRKKAVSLVRRLKKENSCWRIFFCHTV
jgi:4-diphosphocytidyl-2-C-methyl-D-erythritol kinase